MHAPLALHTVPTFWDGDGISAAWHVGKDLFLRSGCKSIQLHTSEPGPTAERVRKDTGNQDINIIVGVGVDGLAKRVAKGEISVERGVKRMSDIAGQALNAGALGVKWNAEGGWKRDPTSEEAKRLRDVITLGLQEVKEQYPELRQLFTSFDHPSYHSTFPWKAWLGEGSPIEEAYWQVYAAGLGKEVNPHRGALPARERSSTKSYMDAVRKHWIRADVPDGQPGDDRDLDWRPYLQLHHVNASDTIAMATKYPTAALWAIRSRSDRHGIAAFLVLCALSARGFWGEFAVRDFQRSVGLKDDNICGPATAAKLGVEWPTKLPEPLNVA